MAFDITVVVPVRSEDPKLLHQFVTSCKKNLDVSNFIFCFDPLNKKISRNISTICTGGQLSAPLSLQIPQIYKLAIGCSSSNYLLFCPSIALYFFSGFSLTTQKRVLQNETFIEIFTSKTFSDVFLLRRDIFSTVSFSNSKTFLQDFINAVKIQKYFTSVDWADSLSHTYQIKNCPSYEPIEYRFLSKSTLLPKPTNPPILQRHKRIDSKQKIEQPQVSSPGFMDIQEFSEYIRGKRIGVVANSSELQEHMIGNEIDANDIVIRFNSFFLVQQHTGIKTNVHAHIYLDKTNCEIPVDVRIKVCKLKERWKQEIQKYTGNQKNFLNFNGSDDAGQNNTTGFVIVKLLLLLGSYSEITLYGFNFYEKKEKSIGFRKSKFTTDRICTAHTVDYEKSVIEKLFIKEGIKYRLLGSEQQKKHVHQYHSTLLAYAPEIISQCIDKYSKKYISTHGAYIPNNSNVHFHNKYIPFAGKALIQYHSEPHLCDTACKIPHYTIPQYPALFPEFNSLGYIRNIVDLSLPQYAFTPVSNKIVVAYTPSSTKVSSNYANKGAAETLPILEFLKKKYPEKFDFIFVTGKSLNASLQAKKSANIIIDECITGSYHRTLLEGLAMGKLSIGYICPEIESIFLQVSKTTSPPYHNVKIAELKGYLEEIIVNKKISWVVSEGEKSWHWMRENWNHLDIIEELEEIYDSAFS